MEDTKNKINVYKLLSANDLVRNQRNIESVLLSGLVQGHEYVFEVSPISGWLYFENTHLIFKQNKPKLPASEEEIKQIIAKYWAQVYKKQAVRAKMNKSTFDFPFLLPQNYELSDIQVVFNPQTLETDHLLCRLSIALTDSVQNKPLPILGSGIDLRIGHNGQIIGFLVRWRPLLGAILTPLLPYKPAKHQHAAADENKEAESEPVLVFELCGENSIQTHLCPYYFIPLGHHSGLLPASMASFVIVFSVENNEQNTVVSVHINGGSGDFTYEWSYLKVELSDVKDVVSAGRADTCRLKAGVFNLLLIVKDKKTGIVKQKMETIYARNNQIDVPKSREIRGCTDPLASNYNPNANSDDGSCTLPPVA